MTDPFMLDQKEAETSLRRLKDSVAKWRRLKKTIGEGGQGSWTEAMEYQLQGLEGSINNGIRDTKWSLDELEETLQLLRQHETQFSEIEDLNLRRSFLESARQELANIELEILVPSAAHQPPPPASDDAGGEGDTYDSADDKWEIMESQKQLCTIAEPLTAAVSGKKSVSWHRHVQLDKADYSAAAKMKQPLSRLSAWVAKRRLWISVSIAVALFVLALVALSVSKAKRVQAYATATTTVQSDA